MKRIIIIFMLSSICTHAFAAGTSQTKTSTAANNQTSKGYYSVQRYETYGPTQGKLSAYVQNSNTPAKAGTASNVQTRAPQKSNAKTKKTHYIISGDKPIILKPELNPNYPAVWEQFAPPQYANAQYLTATNPSPKRKNAPKIDIEENNYWAARKQLFINDFATCNNNYQRGSQNKCYNTLVNRELNRTISDVNQQRQCGVVEKNTNIIINNARQNQPQKNTSALIYNY